MIIGVTLGQCIYLGLAPDPGTSTYLLEVQQRQPPQSACYGYIHPHFLTLTSFCVTYIFNYSVLCSLRE